MATGQSSQPRRGMDVSAVTPGADFNTGEAQAWDALGRLADQVTELQKPALTRRAEQIGAEEGRALAAGEIDEPARVLLPFGEMYEARLAAMERSYLAGVQNDIDAREIEVRREYSHDAAGYESAMAGVRSSFIQSAQPEFAVDIEQYATRRAGAGLADVSENVQRVAIQEAASNLAGRHGVITSRMVNLAREGRANSVEHKLLEIDLRDLQTERLANPAIPYSQAEADEDEGELAVRGVAALYTNHAVEVLRGEGPAAALATLGDILRDPTLQPAEAQTAFEAARSAVNQEIDLETDRINMANGARTRAETEMRRRIDDSAAAVEIGAPEPELTEAEVLAVLGPSGVAEWHRKRADASQRNRLTGSLIGLPRDEATRRAMAALGGAGGVGSVEDLAKPMDAPADFDALAAAIRIVETGNNPARISADPDGAGGAEGGAVGAMQLRPGTARAAAARLGIPYDENRLLNDVAYNEQLGREELRHLLSRYGGNGLLASTAYYAGPGNVDGWVQPVGTVTIVDGKRVVGKGDPRSGEISVAEWLGRIERAGNPLSAAYSRKVAEAMGGGRAAAEWRETQAATIVTNATAGFASDPINFAGQHRLSAPAPLTVDAVFTGGRAAQEWGEAMRSRAALGGNLAEQYSVPLRHFTDGEVAAYRDRFERDPASAILFAREATRALGGRDARDALAEVGQNTNASTAIHIADLATAGDARFSDQAALGLSLRAAGQTLPTEMRDDLAEAFERSRSNFRNSPSLLQAVSNSAEAAALADHAAGVVRPAGYYVQAAMGRSQWQGRSYGGTAQVNGADVLLPRWMNPERSEDALEALAESWAEQGNGPVYGNDEPMPARAIARMRLVMMPDGRYRLVDRDNRVAYSRSGRPLDLDLNVMRPFLTRTLGPSAVRLD